MAQLQRSTPGRRPRRSSGDGRGAVAAYARRGRRRLRARGARAGARPRAGRRDPRPALDRDREARRSSSCAARRPSRSPRFLRSEPPQTIALVHRQPATRRSPRRCWRTCPRTSSPTSRCASPGWARPARTSSSRSSGVMRQKLASVVQPGVRGRRRRQVARRDPQPRRPLDRAQRARQRSPRPTASLGEEVRRLLFVFEDIVKLDDRSIQLVLREVDQKDLALALRGVERRGQGPDPVEHVRARRRDARARRWSSCRRSASATSRRRRAGSSRVVRARGGRRDRDRATERGRCLADAAAATIAAYAFRQLEALGRLRRDAAPTCCGGARRRRAVRQQAWAEGEAEGRAAGMAAMRAELEPSLQAVARAAQALDAVRDQLIAELEQDAVELALRSPSRSSRRHRRAPERIVDVVGVARGASASARA